MNRYRVTLALRAPLGSPLAGDTLFGQLCWALREAHGEAELTRLLDGYTAGHPWLVVGDGLPTGYLPRPTVPAALDPNFRDAQARKAAKGKRWVALADAAQSPPQSLPQLLAAARTDAEVFGAENAPQTVRRHHNTLNRLTGTTGSGSGEFAPYTVAQTHYAAGQAIDLWCVLDESRCDATRLRTLLGAIGQTGFGRDASIGLGQFDLSALAPAVPPEPTFTANHGELAYCTLGPCAPQAQGFDGQRSYWKPLTRFGRHGNLLALGANPFKHPLLLAAAGAVLVPADEFRPRAFVGQGLRGVSSAHADTVHQGYAPVWTVHLESPT